MFISFSHVHVSNTITIINYSSFVKKESVFTLLLSSQKNWFMNKIWAVLEPWTPVTLFWLTSMKCLYFFIFKKNVHMSSLLESFSHVKLLLCVVMICNILFTCVGVQSLQRMCVAFISTFPKLPSNLPSKLRTEVASMITSWKRDIPTANIRVFA